MFTGWEEIERDLDLNYDLENSPLQIKTNIEDGSNKKLEVWFKTAAGESAGAVQLDFTSPPKFMVCSEPWTSFPTALPTESEKVWTITLTRYLFVPLLVITCNDKEVLNVVMNDVANCEDWEWRRAWKRDVEKIRFGSSSDTGPIYYRPGK